MYAALMRGRHTEAAPTRTGVRASHCVRRCYAGAALNVAPMRADALTSTTVCAALMRGRRTGASSIRTDVRALHCVRC